MVKVRFVALDVHKDTIVIAVAEAEGEVRLIGQIPADVRVLQRRLARLAAGGYRLVICYEAGPTGYALQRELTERGYECQVVAPSLVPVKAGERIKTDRRDALKLARCLRAGDLTPVWVPDEQTEALRDLERARDDAKKAERTAKHQLGKFLLRHGRRWDGGTNWTRGHLAWIGRQTFEHEPLRRVLQDYVQTLEQASERVRRLTADIAELITQSTLAPLVTALQALKGIATLSATVIAAEIGDLRRFDSAKQFMAFVGLVPSEHSSGQRRRRGSITRTGNKHVRRILIEAAWQFARSHGTSAALRRRREAVAPEVRQIAESAQRRLGRKFRHLAYERRKPPCVVATAVARELAGFVWAIGQQQSLLSS